MLGTESILYRSISLSKSKGWVKSGELVVAIHGMQEGQTGATNVLKVLHTP